MLLIPVKLNVNDALTRADIRMMEKKIKKIKKNKKMAQAANRRGKNTREKVCTIFRWMTAANKE